MLYDRASDDATGDRAIALNDPQRTPPDILFLNTYE